MGSRLRCLVATGVVLAALAVPTAALSANTTGAPADGVGPLISSGAAGGDIGVGASVVGQLQLVDDVILKANGITPPGNPYSGPQPPPICGAGCGGGI